MRKKFELSKEAKQEIKETIKWTIILVLFTSWPMLVSMIRCLFNI